MTLGFRPGFEGTGGSPPASPDRRSGARVEKAHADGDISQRVARITPVDL